MRSICLVARTPATTVMRMLRSKPKLITFNPNQVVSAPGDGRAADRAAWFLIHMEGLDDRPMTIRKYDSPAVRAREPFAAALRDLDFAIACADALLTQPLVAVGGDPLLQRALWDSCLNALFKHYGQGANRDVKAAFDGALARLKPRDRDAWKALNEERSRRVAHPVGVREGHSIAVSLDASGVPYGAMDVGASALRPIDPAVSWARKLMEAVRTPIAAEEGRRMALIAKEVDSLDNTALLQLPSLDDDQLAIERAPGTLHGLTDLP